MLSFLGDIVDMIEVVLSNLPDYFSAIVDFIENMFTTASDLVAGGDIVLGVLIILLIIKIISMIANLV